MCLRKINLIDERATLKSQTTLDINSRQLSRVEPLCYYLESVLREHHSKEAKHEAFIERRMNMLDKKLYQGHISQDEYESMVKALNEVTA